MKTKIKMLSTALIAGIFTITACQKEDSTPVVSQNEPMLKSAAPIRNMEAILFEDFIQDYNYQPLVNDTSLVFEALAHNPVTAPDGHQLTLAELTTFNGRASMKCINPGTHVVINMHGLIPNGVYSFFVSTFVAPGFTPDLQYMTADGVIGASDGSQNTVTADANGDASISAIIPAGPLSELGNVDNCLSDEFQVLFSGIYHMDGINHGGVPGPIGTWTAHFGFVFGN